MKSVNLVAAVPYNGIYQDGDFIGVDRGASYLFKKNISMIAVVGDFDSTSVDEFKEMSDSKLNIIKLDTHKDETDLEYAIDYASQLDYDHINVYGAVGQRIDHTLVNINLLKKHRSMVLYDDYSKIYILKAGTHYVSDDKYKYYSFFAIEECSISLINFVYPLDKYVLKLDDTLCVSNELKNQAKIIVDKDIIVVASL